MERKLKIAFAALLIFGILLIGVFVFFSDRMILLNPQGYIGVKQRNLIVISTALMMLVLIPVFLMTFYFAYKYRVGKNAAYDPNWDNSHLAEALWWGLPFVIIVILGFLSWKYCYELDPFRRLDPEKKPFRVQVVALEWKWLFIYPEQNVASVNVLHIPYQRPVEFEITGDAPMNSFWIPELGGQIYAMPGMQSKLYLIADKAGEYRGYSAHLSGEGFSGMFFSTIAESEERLSQWVAQAQLSPPLDQAAYEQLLQPSSYVKPYTYRLADPELFMKIQMQYMPEMQHASSH